MKLNVTWMLTNWRWEYKQYFEISDILQLQPGYASCYHKNYL
ncbi:hypothetical protein DsansV1_C31g0216661 [Dioscorea sansibarensis]